MQIAQVLAGYSLGSADLLRRAMGKKKPEEMAKQRSIFVDGAVENGVPEQQAAHIFDLMEKFAGYGFNKSHSAAYALLSYQTGWLKTHDPASFMAAVLSADMDHTDKVVGMLYDCRKEVRPDDPAAARQLFVATNSRWSTTGRFATGSAPSRAWARAQSKPSSASAARTATSQVSKICAAAWICQRSIGACSKR